MNNLSKVQIWLHGLSALSMAAFVYLFVSNNAAGMTRVPVIALLGGTYVGVFLLANPGLLGGRSLVSLPIVGYAGLLADSTEVVRIVWNDAVERCAAHLEECPRAVGDSQHERESLDGACDHHRLSDGPAVG